MQPWSLMPVDGRDVHRQVEVAGMEPRQAARQPPLAAGRTKPPASAATGSPGQAGRQVLEATSSTLRPTAVNGSVARQPGSGRSTFQPSGGLCGAARRVKCRLPQI